MSDDESEGSDINDYWGGLPEGVLAGDGGSDDEEEEVDIRIPGAE